MVMKRSWLVWWWQWELLLGTLVPIMLITSIHGDPTDLIVNGDFETEEVSFGSYPQIDVINDGQMDMIPSWQCVHGGVQLLDNTEYAPNPLYVSQFSLHLNYKYGPGVIISSPIATPRKGATYNLTFDIADNPDGGPLYKVLRAKILVNNEVADPQIGNFNVSTPQSQRSSIAWATVSVLFVGTGESTTIQFESLTVGSFGPLIDNVMVKIVNLVDNGSFETTKSILVQTNTSWYNILVAPSDMITSWTLTQGSIKRAGSVRWQSATDDSSYMLDMNANTLQGTILSNSFITLPGYNYMVLFDASASPEPTIPIMGNIFGAAKTSADGDIVNYAIVEVNADGFSATSIGWETYTFEFTATTTSTVLEFVSKIPGSDGPLLDNVQCYQVVPTGKFKHVPLTYNRATTLPRPSILNLIFTGETMVMMGIGRPQ